MSLHQNYVDLEKGKQAAVSTAQLLKQQLLWTSANNTGLTNSKKYKKINKAIAKTIK